MTILAKLARTESVERCTFPSLVQGNSTGSEDVDEILKTPVAQGAHV